MTTQDIVQKLWNLCHVLRDDGITYHEYVTELTWLLFLKMAKETGREDQLPKGYRWDDLDSKDGVEQLNFYRQLLLHLGTESSALVQAIYVNANTSLKVPRNVKKLTDSIDELDWYSAKTEGLGDLYEGLLEKNANEKKSGAGQYFTPRPRIDAMVHLVKPQAGELVEDPAAGTCGFLIAADRYIKSQTDNLFDLPQKQQVFQRRHAFYGVELVPDTHRLALMNLMLHDIEGDLLLGDSLSPLGSCAIAWWGEIAEDGHDLVMVIRNVVKRSEVAKESLRTAVGIGDGLDAGQTRGVLAALDAIGTNADGLRACGVQNDDIAEAAALATSLRAADASQGASMDSRTASTEDRIDAQLRVQAAVGSIMAKGVLAFRKDPVIRGRFERLVSSDGPSAEDDPGAPPAPPAPA